jgi:hypothetical protein
MPADPLPSVLVASTLSISLAAAPSPPDNTLAVTLVLPDPAAAPTDTPRECGRCAVRYLLTDLVCPQYPLPHRVKGSRGPRYSLLRVSSRSSGCRGPRCPLGSRVNGSRGPRYPLRIAGLVIPGGAGGVVWRLWRPGQGLGRSHAHRGLDRQLAGRLGGCRVAAVPCLTFPECHPPRGDGPRVIARRPVGRSLPSRARPAGRPLRRVSQLAYIDSVFDNDSMNVISIGRRYERLIAAGAGRRLRPGWSP